MALQDFFAGLQEKWEGFLQWSDEKGLPFRGWNDALEARGIPAMPVFALVVIAILVGAFFLIAGVPQIPGLTAPQTGMVKLTVFSDEGIAVPDAAVQLKVNGKIIATKNTNSNGIVTFSDVPAGALTAIASAADFTQQYTDLTAKAGETSSEKIVLVRVSNLKVTITVQVDGPQSANFTVSDENKTAVIETASGASVSFDLEPSKNYNIRAEADGYTSEERLVPVGTTNAAPIYMRLFKVSEARTGTLHIGVYDEKGLTGAAIANATVEVRANSSEAPLATGATDSEGGIDPVEVPVGATITVFASASGYLSAESEAFQVPEGISYKRVRLAKKTEDNSKAIAVSVITLSGEYVSSPTVRLYCGSRKREEKTPAGGTTSFDAAQGEKCLITAFKEGYLPTSKQVTAKAEVTLTLVQANSLNSASLKVSVLDSSGNPVPAAEVALYNSTSEPLGIPENRAGLDGTTTFNQIPAGSYLVKASSGNTEGSAKTDVALDANNSVQVSLKALKAKVAVLAQDYYSNASIANAKVVLKDATGATSSCVTSVSGCILEAEEGPATITVTASNYDSYDGTLALKGGATTNYSAQLVSAAVAADVKLVFLGVFDSKGKAVKTLSPSTVYTARYLIRAPDAPFSSAEAFVLAGSASGSLDSEDAEIIEYSADGASMVAGADFSSAAEFSPEATATPTPSPTATAVPAVANVSNATSQEIASTPSGGVAELPSTKGTSLLLNRETWKWVQFTFSSFNGTKELRVKIRTKPVSSGTLELNHRSAFTTERGVLRDPEDAAAGASKSPLLATLKPSGTFAIFFAGECDNGLCVQAYLEGQQGKSGDSLEALIPEQFKARFNIISSSGDSTVTLSTDSAAVQIVDVAAGAVKSAARPVSEGTQELSVKSKGGEGVFNVKAKSFAKDVKLTFNVQGADGNYEKVFSVRVTSPKNVLKVAIKPERMVALQENKLTFTVTDAFNNPIPNARITVGADGDALGTAFEAEAQTGKNVPEGTYVADKLSPKAYGTVEWKVEAEGYKLKRGELDSIARKIIELSTRTLSLNADGQPVAFTVTNLLGNEVSVSAAVLPDDNPKYTEFKLNPYSAKLKPNEEREFTITARVKPEVLTVADKDGQLSEKMTGRVHIAAKLADVTQDEDMKLTSTNMVQRSALSGLVEYSDESLDFSLNPPRTAKESKKLTITNKAPYPVLVNQQSLAPNVRVTPLSLTIPAQGKGEFTVTAGLPPESVDDKCIIDDVTKESDVEFYASYQGINSTKVVKAKIALTASTRCYIADGLTYNLPVPVVFKFPAGTKVRSAPSDDGSIPVLLPDGNKVVFFEGSSMYGPYAAERSGVSFGYGQNTYNQYGQYGTGYNYGSYPQYGQYGSSMYSQTQAGLSAMPYAQSPYGSSIPYYPASSAAPYYQNPSSYFGGTIQTQTQTSSVTLQQAVVPAGVGFVMSSKYSRQLTIDPVTLASNIVAVTFPSVVFIELPADAQPVPDAAGVRYNLRNAYVVLPPNLPTMRAPSYGNIVQVQPGVQVLFGRSGSQAGSMELSYDEETYIDLPADATIQQLPNGVQATLTDCTPITIKSLDDKMTDTTPAAKAVFVEGGSLFGGRKNRIIVPAESKIRVSTCLDVTDEQQKRFCSSRREAMTLILPPGFRGPPSRFTLAFDSCMPVDIKGGRGSQISAVRKIFFEPTAKGKEVKSGDQTLYEVTIPEGSQFCALPCDASGTVSVTAYGNYLDFTPKSINITLSDSKPTATAELCLLNTGSELLEPYSADSYVELISASTNDDVFNSIIKKSGIYFPGQVGKPANLQLSFENKKCNKLTIEASLPSTGDWLDAYGCVKKEGTIAGSIKFHAKSSKWQGAVSVPVTVTVVKEAKGCTSPAALDPSNSLQTFFVNYADSKFSFKGPNQFRFITLANNLLESVTITSNLDGSSPIKCDFPSEMAVGAAQVVKCISLKPADGFLMKITAKTKRSDTPIEARVTVNVFSPDATTGGLYSSSPLGELVPTTAAPATATAAPATTASAQPAQPAGTVKPAAASEVSFANAPAPATPPATPPSQTTAQKTAAAATPQKTVVTDAYYITCEKYFCDATQAGNAYKSFLTNMKAYLDSVIADAVTHQRFCQTTIGGEGGPKVVEKSIVLQKVAATQSIDDFNNELLKAANQVLADYTGTDNFFQGAASGTVAGCGWYKVSVALDACKEMGSHSEADWKKRVGLRVRVDKLPESSECTQTLANAPLFLRGNSPDSLGVTVGDRVAVWPSEVSKDRLLSVFDKSKDNWNKVQGGNPATWLYLLDIGVLSLGPYADQGDENDVKGAQTLYQYLYGQQYKGAAKSVYYDNREFCSANGPQQLKWIAVGGVSMAAAGSALALIPTGGSQVVAAFLVPLGLKLTAATATTAALCLGSTVAYGNNTMCKLYNDCIRSAIFGAATAALPTAGELAAFKSASTALKTTAMLTAATAGVTSAVNLLAPDGPEAADASIPLVAAGYAASTTVSGSLAAADAASPMGQMEQKGFVRAGSDFEKEFNRLVKTGMAPADAAAQAQTNLINTYATRLDDLVLRNPAELTRIATEHGAAPAIISTDTGARRGLAAAMFLEDARPTQYLTNQLKLPLTATNKVDLAFATGFDPSAFESVVKTGLVDKDATFNFFERYIAGAGTPAAQPLLQSPSYIGNQMRDLAAKGYSPQEAYKLLLRGDAARGINPVNTDLLRRAFIQGNFEPTYLATIGFNPATATSAQLTDFLEGAGRNSFTNVVTEAEAALKRAVKVPVIGAEAAEKTILTTAATKLDKAKGAVSKGSTALKAGAQIAATLLFQVDVRPVMAKLDPALPSHFVVYHLTKKGDNYVPTSYKLCVTEKRPGIAPDANGCAQDQSFYLADLCNSDYSACIYQTPVYTTVPSAQAYNLIVAVNDPKLDSKAFLESVFLPDAKPVGGNIGGGQLSAADIARLATTTEEKGTGKAFAGK